MSYPDPGTNPYQPQYPQSYQQQQHAGPAHKKPKKKWPWIVGGIAAFIVLVGGCSAAMAPDKAKEGFEAGYNAPETLAQVMSQPPTTEVWTPKYTPPVAKAPASTGYKQNKLLTIGVDIQPGPYTFVVPEDAFLGFVYTCSVGSDCNSAMTATDTDMFSAGEEGEYTVPQSGYIKLDDVLLTPMGS
jgi:hypothetical protein